MPESTQHKLDRIRPPRVQITYDVETRGSFVKMELPFVVGIMADLSTKGGAKDEQDNTIPLRNKKYMEVDRDNFDDIMSSIKPSVALNGGSTTYTFESLEDFTPIRLLKPANTELNKVDANDASPLGLARADYDRRTKLSDMVAKLDGNVPLQKRFLVELRKDNGQELKDTVQAIKDEATPPAASPELKTRDAAQKDLEAAQQKVLEAQQKVEAKKLVDDAQAQVGRATEKLTAAKTASTPPPAADTGSTPPPAAKSPEEQAVADAKTELGAKQTALDVAQKALDAKKQVDDAQAQVDKAQKRLAEAKEQLTPGSTVAGDAPTPEATAVTDAQKALDDAQKALAAKTKATLDAAQQEVVKETSELKAATDKANELQAAQDKPKKEKG